MKCTLGSRAVRVCRKVLLWLSACAMVVLVVPLVASPAQASEAATSAGAPSFIFAPYNEATQGVIRASFHYTMAPGSTVADTLVLANPTSYEETFKIWAADAYNTSLGGALRCGSPATR